MRLLKVSMISYARIPPKKQDWAGHLTPKREQKIGQNIHIGGPYTFHPALRAKALRAHGISFASLENTYLDA